MTAGYTAMSLFNRDAVSSLNKLTVSAIRNIEDVIAIAGVPVSVTGAGSMFRLHLKPSPPETYREAYQSKEVQSVIKSILDHMFYEEKILMINTLACMFSTVMTQKEVEILSNGLLNAFRKFKKEIEQLNK
jgi:glutamate-1-semialdehyde 2,1-aminomutase